MKSVQLGGDRLGSQGDMNVELNNYERSSHDLSYIWKSTMGVGTLVPFMSELALPGDSFEIKLDTDIRTIPTNGPLFGSFKTQLDVFKCPIRLYMKELHNNKLGVGLNMKSIALPQIKLQAKNPVIDADTDYDNYQIEPSCIMSYFNIRGIGYGSANNQIYDREFNCLPFLAYWDVYKNYYANKQEEIGAVIHTQFFANLAPIIEVTGIDSGAQYTFTQNAESVIYAYEDFNAPESGVEISVDSADEIDLARLAVRWVFDDGEYFAYCNTDLVDVDISPTLIEVSVPANVGSVFPEAVEVIYFATPTGREEPYVATFPLDDIDKMREYLLMNTGVVIDKTIGFQPYNLLLQTNDSGANDFETALQFKQEGLGIKTYQSDLFNNWLSTEWLDGTNGVNEITKVAVDEDGFYLDDLIVMKKVYNMLHRVAVSDGSYKSWLETVYGHNIKNWVVESPMYLGGLIKELAFDEVISTAETSNEETNQPLGTLAGKGVMTKKHKGGYIDARIDEPSYILGIVSLTPRIDYSQGNKWDTNLKTMDDFHKPQLDGIGFQELITDQMAWFDTTFDSNGQPVFKSAGKQPAWVNYMANVNQSRGNFAIDGQEMFMTLNRNYDLQIAGNL